MAKKKVYRFVNHCQGQRKRAESAGFPATISALATVLARRSGRSSALPYPPFERCNSTIPACFCHWTVFRCEFLIFNLLRWMVFRD
jgi:hypothetical protein